MSFKDFFIHLLVLQTDVSSNHSSIYQKDKMQFNSCWVLSRSCTFWPIVQEFNEADVESIQVRILLILNSKKLKLENICYCYCDVVVIVNNK